MKRIKSKVVAKQCENFIEVGDDGYCYGAKATPQCYCGGDRAKCSEYAEVREEAKEHDLRSRVIQELDVILAKARSANHSVITLPVWYVSSIYHLLKGDE